MITFRTANEDDIPPMLALAAQKRAQYEAYQPVFHRRAANAVDAQRPYYRELIERDDVLVLVAVDGGAVISCISAIIHTAPAVYDPGGPAAMVDDYMVATPDMWPTVGRELLDAVKNELRSRGVVVMIVVCGHRDEPKRRSLIDAGLTLASEWYVQPLAAS